MNFTDPIAASRPGGTSRPESSMLTEPFKPESWARDALCAQTDPEMFFPEKGGSTKDAKSICAACDVKVQCLQYALDNQERFGLWGGTSERERRKMQKASAS